MRLLMIPLACLAFGSIALICTVLSDRPHDSQCSQSLPSPHGEGGDHSVPELDPGSIGSALTLLGLGTAMLIDRRRPK